MTVKSWLDNLRPASFRGVPFEVDTADKSFGPRTITHEFPLRNDVSHEFIGKLPRTFSLEMVLIGDDLFDQVKRLEDALDNDSPGRLVHPWYGELDVVVVGEVHTKTSSSEGRVARITTTFQLTGGQPSPTTRIDTAAAVDRNATAARQAAIGDFSRNFTVDGTQDFVVQRAIGTITSIVEAVRGQFKSGGLSSLTSNGTLAPSSTDLLAIDGAGLQNPGQLAGQIGDLFTYNSATSKPDQAVSTSLNVLAAPTGLPSLDIPPAGVTPSWKRVATNQSSLIGLAQVMAAIEAARSGSAAGWESRDQAMTWRDKTSSNLDDAADFSGASRWDATWQAATDLRAVTVRDVAVRAAPLPRMTSFRPTVTLPAALIAYHIDGDDLTSLFDRQDDLRRRNRLRHPGFVAGGRPLEVLSNG